MLAFFYLDCRRSGIHRPGLEIAGSNRSQTQNRSITDIYARANTGPGTYPGVGPEFHRKRQQRERRVVEVVRRAADIATLRQDRVGANFERRWIVNFCPVGYSNQLIAGQVPWRVNDRARIKLAARGKFGPEKPQKHRSPGKKGSR